MGNYNRLISGEFPPAHPPNEHQALLERLDKEMEEYMQETVDWIEKVKANPHFDVQEGEK